MKRKRGRPKGTTRANGFKVAVDTDKYWNARLKSKKPIFGVILEKEHTGNDVFMIKVKNGLKEFLSPFYRSN